MDPLRTLSRAELPHNLRVELARVSELCANAQATCCGVQTDPVVMSNTAGNLSPRVLESFGKFIGAICIYASDAWTHVLTDDLC